MKISIILPARNEAVSLGKLLPEIKNICPDSEIIVVNDGSSDDTADTCKAHGVVSVNHSVSLGNGAAIKAGARKASGDVLVFLDADGQHLPKYIPELLARIDEGYDMVIGARDKQSHAGSPRYFANLFYNRAMPELEDYYEPFTFKYEDLFNAPESI